MATIEPHCISEYAGITGVIRFRRQSLTGCQVLQVEQLFKQSVYRGPRIERLSWIVDWKDATDIEAAQIALNTGFVRAGENIVKVDDDGRCLNEKGDVVARVVNGSTVYWCGGTVKDEPLGWPVTERRQGSRTQPPPPPPPPPPRSIRGGKVTTSSGYQPDREPYGGVPQSPPKKP